MSLSTWFRSAKSDLSDLVRRATSNVKPIAGVLVGGVAIQAIGAGERAADRLKARIAAQIAAARGEVKPETRAGIVGLFGGVPVSTILILGALVVGAFVILRKK